MSAKKPQREKVKNQQGIYKITWTDTNGIKKVKFGYQVMVNGKRVSKNDFATVEEALAAKLERMKELTRSNGNGGQISFEALFDRHIEHGVTVMQRRDGFVKEYNALKKRFPDTVLSKRAVDVTVEDAQRVVDQAKGNGDGKKRVHAQIKAIFNHLVKVLKINHNPVLEIPTPKTNKKTTAEKNGMKYCPPKEHIEMLAKIMTQEQHDFYVAMFICAARAGYSADESGFASMTWADVDFDNEAVYIHNFKNGGREASVAKSVKLQMVDSLREILERRLAHKKADTDLVFYRMHKKTGETRKWSGNDDVAVDGLKALCRQLDIKEFSAGALRNARAGYLFDMGVGVRVIQQILGHTDLEMTFRYLESLGKSVNAGSVIEAMNL